MNSRGSNGTSVEFTARAAVHLERHYRNSPFHSYANDRRPVLDNVNIKGYKRLERIIHKTFPKCDIFKIHRVNIPEMYGMYLLRKEEMRLTNGGNNVQELVLFHVTANSRAMEMLKNGLDWRLTRRSKFGCGVSFTNDVDYGNYHANRSNNEGIRVVIVSTVLISDTYLVTNTWNPRKSLIIPPGTSDTTVSPNGHVFVKYTDFESYPLFFVYYRWTLKLLNESKYFEADSKNNNNQTLSLCRQVANLCVGESSSRRRRSRR